RLENITRPNPTQRLAAKKARRVRDDDLDADWADETAADEADRA
ncbi:MAG: hypothetical protein QOG22_2886, partial [Pseudonocardiales bacterium]|nr:hypothetical protein [Pseudonocardiales bacterium]